MVRRDWRQINVWSELDGSLDALKQKMRVNSKSAIIERLIETYNQISRGEL